VAYQGRGSLNASSVAGNTAPARKRSAVEGALASGKPAVMQIVTDAEANANDAPGMDQFATWYEGA
jgi:hypothetical protein